MVKRRFHFSFGQILAILILAAPMTGIQLYGWQLTQPAPKLTIETLEKGVKYVQS